MVSIFYYIYIYSNTLSTKHIMITLYNSDNVILHISDVDCEEFTFTNNSHNANNKYLLIDSISENREDVLRACKLECRRRSDCFQFDLIKVGGATVSESQYACITSPGQFNDDTTLKTYDYRQNYALVDCSGGLDILESSRETRVYAATDTLPPLVIGRCWFPFRVGNATYTDCTEHHYTRSWCPISQKAKIDVGTPAELRKIGSPWGICVG